MKIKIIIQYPHGIIPFVFDNWAGPAITVLQSQWHLRTRNRILNFMTFPPVVVRSEKQTFRTKNTQQYYLQKFYMWCYSDKNYKKHEYTLGRYLSAHLPTTSTDQFLIWLMSSSFFLIFVTKDKTESKKTDSRWSVPKT